MSEPAPEGMEAEGGLPPPNGMTYPQYVKHLRELAKLMEGKKQMGLAYNFTIAANVVDYLSLFFLKGAAENLPKGVPWPIRERAAAAAHTVPDRGEYDLLAAEAEAASWREKAAAAHDAGLASAGLPPKRRPPAAQPVQAAEAPPPPPRRPAPPPAAPQPLTPARRAVLPVESKGGFFE